MTGFQNRLLRLGGTIAALAVAVLAVWGFRLGVRRLVLGPSGVETSFAYRNAEPDYQPAPRVYSLSEMIPEDLHQNIGGLPLRTVRTEMDMPFDQAVKTGRDLAAASGWKPLELPLAQRFAVEMTDQFHFRTPDGDFVIRSFIPVDVARTTMLDTTLPAAENLHAPNADLTFTEIAGAHALETLSKMPAPIVGIMVGNPFITMLMERGNGAAFHVSTLSPLSVAEAQRELMLAWIRDGWIREDRSGIVLVKDNLQVIIDIGEGENASGSALNYRFTDDETLCKKKGNTDEDR